MSQTHVLYVGNNNVVEVADLQDEIEGDFLNAATVEITLNDSSGNPIAGTWPLTVDYVTDSQGLYRVILPDTLPIEDNVRYKLEISADAGTGLHGFWVLDCVGKIRR